MDAAKRNELIRRYRDGATVVGAALAGVTERELDARPAPSKWSAREIVHHLADSELVAALRLRRLLTEERPALRATDLAGYVRRLHYDRPIHSSLALLGAVRASTAELLERIGDAEWGREGVQAEAGRFTVEKWLEICAQHAHTHAEQIQKARAAAG